jgi:hypothetical protein
MRACPLFSEGKTKNRVEDVNHLNNSEFEENFKGVNYA